MPVAALIVVGPGIEVKTVESDSLCTDWDHCEGWTNVAIETIFVHAEIRRGVAQPDETRQERSGFRKKLRSPCRRSS
jgi:hypothetical protein